MAISWGGGGGGGKLRQFGGGGGEVELFGEGVYQAGSEALFHISTGAS